jgi:hypothetical protein
MLRRAILTLLLGGVGMAEAQATPATPQSSPPPSESEETAGLSPPPLVLEPITVTAPPAVAAPSKLVEFGDFATAGAVNFVTLDFVPENIVQAAGGSWGT